MEQQTALLIMDMQAGIVGSVPNKQPVLDGAKKAIDKARSKGIPVIFVTVGFREGAPELNDDNKMFGSASRQRFAQLPPDAFMEIVPDLKKEPGDIHVIKRRVSAFAGSDLEVVLRAKGIRHLVLSGFATSGVVLSTLRYAADQDYRLTVIADACGDREPEVHDFLVTKIFPKQADVVSVDEWK